MQSSRSESSNKRSSAEVYLDEALSHHDRKDFKASLEAIKLSHSEFLKELNRLNDALQGNPGPLSYAYKKKGTSPTIPNPQDISKQIVDIKENLILCTYYIGVNNFNLGNSQAAQAAFVATTKEVPLVGYWQLLALAYHYLGVIQVNRNNHSPAFKIFSTSANLFENLIKAANDIKQKRQYEEYFADDIYYKGFCSRKLGNYKEAKDFYDLALKKYNELASNEELEFRKLQTAFESIIVSIKINNENCYQAPFSLWTLRAIAYGKQSDIKYKIKLAEIDQWMAIAYLKSEQPQAAIMHLDNSLKYFTPETNQYNYLCLLVTKGLCYVLKGDAENVKSNFAPLLDFLQKSQNVFLNEIVAFLINELLIEPHLKVLQNSTIPECQKIAEMISNFRATIQLQQPLNTEVKQPESTLKIKTVPAAAPVSQKMEIEEDESESESKQQSSESKKPLEILAVIITAPSNENAQAEFDALPKINYFEEEKKRKIQREKQKKEGQKRQKKPRTNYYLKAAKLCIDDNSESGRIYIISRLLSGELGSKITPKIDRITSLFPFELSFVGRGHNTNQVGCHVKGFILEKLSCRPSLPLQERILLNRYNLLHKLLFTHIDKVIKCNQVDQIIKEYKDEIAKIEEASKKEAEEQNAGIGLRTASFFRTEYLLEQLGMSSVLSSESELEPSTGDARKKPETTTTTTTTTSVVSTPNGSIYYHAPKETQRKSKNFSRGRGDQSDNSTDEQDEAENHKKARVSIPDHHNDVQTSMYRKGM